MERGFKVNIQYVDKNSLTTEEVSRIAKDIHGENAVVEVTSVNDSVDAHLYYAIQKLITEEQIAIFFEFYPHLYEPKLEELKSKVLTRVQDVFYKVVKDNEEKVS